MLAVVVADVGGEGEYRFERRKVGATSDELHLLAQWLVQQEVEEVVMESTAQYWKPVWGALERFWKPGRQKREGAAQMPGTLHLCQAKSNRGPLCRMLWKILHEGAHYEERGPAVSAKSQHTRTARMIKELQKLGYHVAPIPVGTPA